MGKSLSQYAMTEEKRTKRRAEGRGTGEGRDYKRGLNFDEVPPHGHHRHRVKEGRWGRQCDLFSNVERDVFLYYDACNIKDLWDQFPLPIEETREIARDLGIDHPRDPITRVDIDITTDLVVKIVVDGQIVLLPRSCKPISKFSDFNQAEHAEIERRWWLLRRGAVWRFSSNDPTSIHPMTLENLLLMEKCRRMQDEEELYEGHLALVAGQFLEALCRVRHPMPLGEFRKRFAEQEGFDPAFVVRISHWLIYRREINADLSKSRIELMGTAELARRTLDALEGIKNGKSS